MMRRAASSLATLIATGLGSGFAPVAPGTAGSAVGLALFWPLARLSWPSQLAAIGAVFFVGVVAASAVARRLAAHDPSIVVVDEVAGMWVSLLALPFTAWTAAVAFVLFRIADVVKPWPAGPAERFRGGWGIMADDVIAGVYVNIALRLALFALR